MKCTIPWVLALSVLSLSGCSSAPSFDQRVLPVQPVCSDEGEPGPCPGSQVCLSGRCFEACANDGDCAARERCESGVCVGTGGGGGIDGGRFDAGTPSIPCDDACGDGEVCDVRTDDCVSCVDAIHCSGETPLCDYARGECIAANAGAACQSCNDSADCAGGADCVLRGAYTERVCLLPCADGACASGFSCVDGLCQPPFGGCTQLRRSLDRLMCESDVQCVARGGTAESGTCSSLTMTCLAACQVETGCPDGWTCDGMYCQPSAADPAAAR